MADPDLQIREGPGHPDPEIRRGAGLQKNFSALRALVWSNNRPGSLPWIRHLFTPGNFSWRGLLYEDFVIQVFVNTRNSLFTLVPKIPLRFFSNSSQSRINLFHCD